MAYPRHVAFCEKHYPFPPDHGRATRVVTLTRAVRALGSQVTLIVVGGKSTTSPDGVRVRSIPPLIWPFRELLLWHELRKTNRELPVDFFHVQNDVFVILGILSRLTGFRVLYDAQVVEKDYWSVSRTKSLRDIASSKIMPLCERLLCRFSERITVLSDADGSRLEEMYGLAPGKVVVIPLSPRRVKERRDWDEAAGASPKVLFLGSYEHWPNADAIEIIGREIRPRVLRKVPNAVFQVVGKGLPTKALEANGFEVFSNVEDVTPFIDAATVCVAPVRIGSGVRTKVVEYMSRGKPVVAMTPAMEGLPVRSGVDLLVSDGFDSFADNIVVLLKNPALRQTIGSSGLDRILEFTKDDRIGHALSALYSEGPES